MLYVPVRETGEKSNEQWTNLRLSNIFKNNYKTKTNFSLFVYKKRRYV